MGHPSPNADTPAPAAHRSSLLVGCVLAFLSGMGFMHGVARFEVRFDREALIENPATWSDANASVPVDSEDPIWGSRSALVTIVVFSDFECPHCAALERTLDWVKDHYDPSDVRIVWKNNPLGMHAHARPAAIAGNTVFKLAGSRAFWRWAALAFDHQRSLDRDDFADWAEEAGVDRARFIAAFDANEFAAKIDADMELATRLSLVGAPMSLVNGILVRGSAQPEKMSRIIEEAMSRARAISAEATPRDEVYVRATLENLPPLEPLPPPEPPRRLDMLDRTIYRVALDAEDVVRGPANALVTVVQFGDFGASTRATFATVEKVLGGFGERVRFVFRPTVRPSDEDGWRAANILLEAGRAKGDAGYWAAYTRLLEPSILPDAKAVVADLGLDGAALEAAIKGGAHSPRLARFASAALDLEIPTYPALFVNGRRFTGPPSEDELRTLVEEELARSASTIESGGRAEDVYASVVARATDLPVPEKRPLPPPPARAPSRGATRAPIVVQVFGDLQSPYSHRARTTLAELERTFAGSIRIVWRHRPLPVDKYAVLAAEAALEARAQKGDEGFWTFVDAAFEAQNRGPDALARPALVAIAKRLGFDAKAFDAALESHVHRKDVEADARIADEAGIGGVPSYSINGWFLAGNVPYARLARTVDLALRDVAAGATPTP